MSTRPRSALYPYQEAAVRRLVAAPQQAIFLVCGLGKTAVTLTALHDLHVRRTLVIAPATVVEMDVWGREARAWEHTRGMVVCPICGSTSQRQRLLSDNCATEVISYENAIWLSNEVDLAERYDAIVFDELSKLKHPGTARFKRLRARAARIPVRFGLTGTPVGNHLLDTWGELFMVAGGDPLGSRFTDFRKQYFDTERVGYNAFAVTYHPKPTAEADIHKRIAPYAFSLSEKLAADRLPEVRVNPVEVPLPKEVKRIEDDLAHECIAELENGAELKALGASALASKVRQLASGAVYTSTPAMLNYELGGHGGWEEVHRAKLDALQEMLDELQGEPLLLFYWYKHEEARLLRDFKQARVLAPATMAAWNERKIELLLAHPQSAGHGLNLQSGGFNVCWFTLPWSLELWQQGNGRLARVGQKSPYVVANVLLGGEADHAVLTILKEKNRVQSDLMKALQLEDVLL